MAHKKQIAQAAARKHELVAQLATNRMSISHRRHELAGKLKPKNLVRNIFTRKPKTIFAGSVLASLLTTLLIRRPKKTRKPSGSKTNKQILLAWALSLLKPVAKVWLINLAKQLATERLSHPSAKQPSQDASAVNEQVIIQR